MVSILTWARPDPTTTLTVQEPLCITKTDVFVWPYEMVFFAIAVTIGWIVLRLAGNC